MGSIVLYLGVFLTSTFFLCKGRQYQKKINIMSIIGLTTLIIFAAGRYHVGTDAGTYNSIFTRYASYDWQTFFKSVDTEWLYAIIAKVTFAAGGRVLTWGVFAALIVIPVYITLREQYPYLSFFVAMMVFLVAYYTTSFNVTRQFVAVSLVFWGLKFVYNNRFIPFVVTVAVASGFHQTAIVAVLMWFLWDHRREQAVTGWKRGVFLLGITLIVCFYQYILEHMSSNVTYLNRFSDYAEINTGGQNRDLIVFIIELVILFFLKKRICCVNKRNDFLYSLLIISVLIGFTGYTQPQIKRIAYYFALPARVILFSYLPECFTKNSHRISKILITGWVVALFFLTAYVLKEANLIPYQFDLHSEW